MKNPLPLATTIVRNVRVGAVPVQLLFRDADRRYYLVQNPSTTDSIKVTSTQAGGTGQIIGPTGAKIVDVAAINELWASNVTGATEINVSVEEVRGYTPYEIRTLMALETIAAAMAKGAK